MLEAESALVRLVGVLQADGTFQLNTMHPSLGWAWGAWVQLAIWIDAG